MKKYSIYALIFCFLFSGIFSLIIWSTRNDFSLGLRETTDYENTSVGDRNEIKDLEYQLTINDNNQYWLINGHGEEMTTTYHKGNVKSSIILSEQKRHDMYYSYTIKPVMNKKYIDQEKVKSSSQLGYNYSNSHNFDVTEVMNVDFEFIIQDIAGTKIESSSFKLKGKNSKEPLKISYGYNDFGDKFFNVMDGDQTTNRKSYQGIFSFDTENLQADKYSYFYIGAGAFTFNTQNVKFSKPVGGIYRIDSQKKVKQIVSVDLDETTLYTMAIYKNQLYVIMRKKDVLYLQKYDQEGTLLKEQRLDIKANLSYAKIEINNDVLLIHTREADDELTNKTFVLNMNDISIKKIFNYPVKADESLYKYKDGKLTIVSSDDRNLYIRVIQEDKTLYDSEFFGDYLDDEKIITPDRSPYNNSTYYNSLYKLLNLNHRSIDVNWIK